MRDPAQLNPPITATKVLRRNNGAQTDTARRKYGTPRQTLKFAPYKPQPRDFNPNHWFLRDTVVKFKQVSMIRTQTCVYRTVKLLTQQE
jgi:hypothetical protein